jgi:hypothetical protein
MLSAEDGMPDSGLKLFVSHVSEDRAAALEIIRELERHGVSCWIAPRDVRAGRPFDDQIAEAIENCQAMLLVFSSRCNGNEYIRREVTVAGESNKIIVPLRIENAQPQGGLRMRLSDLHWIDAFVDRERAVAEMVRNFRPAESAAPRSSEPQQASRLAIEIPSAHTRPAEADPKVSVPPDPASPTVPLRVPALAKSPMVWGLLGGLVVLGATVSWWASRAPEIPSNIPVSRNQASNPPADLNQASSPPPSLNRANNVAPPSISKGATVLVPNQADLIPNKAATPLLNQAARPFSVDIGAWSSGPPDKAYCSQRKLGLTESIVISAKFTVRCFSSSQLCEGERSSGDAPCVPSTNLRGQQLWWDARKEADKGDALGAWYRYSDHQFPAPFPQLSPSSAAAQ